MLVTMDEPTNSQTLGYEHVAVTTKPQRQTV